jgi:dUTP pyrophosphatase
VTRLAVRRLHPRAQLPARAHDGDAGLDLVAVEDVELGPGERASVATGIAIEVPPGHAGLVLPRSGLAARHGVALVNAPGLIDAGFRGEVRVLLLNTDRDEAVALRAGDRVAQLVVVAVAAAEPVEVAELGATARGQGGFGSSGGFGRGGGRGCG